MKRLGLAAIAIALGLGAQALAAAMALGELRVRNASVELWGPPLALHLAGVTIGVEGLRIALGQRAIRAGMAARIMAIAACAFVPVLGLLGFSLALVGTIGWMRTMKPLASICTYDVPALPARAVVGAAEPLVGQGSLFGKIRNAADPQIRLRAVMATRPLAGRAATQVLRFALRDPSDDVRLLAYAILDGREAVLYRRINELATGLSSPADSSNGDGAPGESGAAHRRLAEAYWELAYQGLADGELLAYVLWQARTHAALALDGAPDDPSLTLLFGRILLRQREYKEARETLARARSLGLPARTVNLYLAEVAFAERRFDEVRTYLATLAPEDLRRPTVKRLADFWCGVPA